METLVVSQHGSHRYHGAGAGFHASCGHYRFSPPRGLKGLNYRAVQAGIGVLPYPEPPRRCRSSPIPVPSRPFAADDSDELWAGPAYTNSPPPSSLPIPNFSLCERRSVAVGADGHRMAVSAPASPRKDTVLLPTPQLVVATWDLCRILNLDVGSQ